jgi:hypothetical protein
MYGNTERCGKLRLYYNDFSRFLSVIISQSNEEAALYLTYDVPNYFYGSDPNMIAYTLNWMDNLKRKAQPLSSQVEFNLTDFFQKAKSDIWKIKKEMGNGAKATGYLDYNGQADRIN